MKHPLTRVLCLGIDAASPPLLRKWAEEGYLPTLKNLFQRGLSGSIAGVDGFFVGSTWPSFYSGVSPARHGFHYLVQVEPGTYDFHRPAGHGISLKPPFWEKLSDAGRRVAVLDVPLTQVQRNLNGIQVVEWGGHDSIYGLGTWPGDLAASIRSRFGDHPLGPTCDGVRKNPRDYEKFLGKLERGIAAKTLMTRHFLNNGDWDFFMQVFTESHCVGHQCWHLHDPKHPAHDPDLMEKIGNPVLRIYRAIDRALGEILAEAEDTFIMVFSAHGMRHSFGASFLLRDILFRLGVAAPPPKKEDPATTSAAIAGLRKGWRMLPHSLRRYLTPLRDRFLQQGNPGSALPGLGVDVSSSACFPVPNGLAVGGIRLNLKGREPQGVLEPKDAVAFTAGLIRALLEIKDNRTGRPLIREVRRTAELYEGDLLHRLPDLLVKWDDEAATGSTVLGGGRGAKVTAESEKIGTVEGVNDYGRSGEHRRDGLFVAVGPQVQTGRLEQKVSILDLAPTLAARLGVELNEVEGKPIPELESEDLL